jgi:nickel-dependent lactate racemase
MNYEFPYAGFGGLDIPDTCRVDIYSPRTAPAADESRVIADAIASPIGMPRLSRAVRPGQSVLVVVDDISRPTPADRIIPHVLRELSIAGVNDGSIKFLIALGTHRPMAPREIAAKVGDEVARRYPVLNHEWNNPAELHDFGTLGDGTRVVLSRHLREAGFVIGIGGIAPHPAAGFSGGGKIIAPGVATEAAVGDFHWASVQAPQQDVLGVRDNPMRRQIDAIAKMAGLRAIVNVVQDGCGRVVHCVAGEPVEAHRAGCRMAMDVYGVKIPRPHEADIFIADTHPLDQELWQGVKAMCALDCIAPDGAAVIVVTPSPEGVAVSHPKVAELGYVTLAKGRELLAAGKVGKVACHNMVQGGRLVRRTSALLVSPGVSASQAAVLGFGHCATPQQALDAALEIKGRHSRIIILRMGGEICPIATD